MTRAPEPDDATSETLARLAQTVDPPPGAYPEVVGRLRSRGLIGRPSPLGGWLLAAGAAAAAAAIAVTMMGRPVETREYLLLLEEPAGYQAARSDAEQRERVREYGSWAGELSRDHHLISAGELEPGGSVLSPSASRALPPDATPTGYFLIQAESLDAAERLARSSPHLRYGGAIVVRAVVTH
jgi:hypothetical protein